MTFQCTRERLVLVLLAFLPFHAFLVTLLTKVIAGPGHAPFAQLALWKEGLLSLILLMAIVETLRNGKWKMENGKLFTIDAIDCVILSLSVLACIVSIFNFQFSIFTFTFGFKYDLLPLLSFVILRRVPWSDAFQKLLVKVLIAVGCIVAAYGIIAEFLPLRFFVWLGYSDLHSLYVANGPLAAFQELEGGMMRRAQSFMSGPNQLGLWLLIPFGVLLGGKKKEGDAGKRFGIGALLFAGLILSFSRAAWIAAAVMIIFACVKSTNALHCRKICALILGFFACFAIAIAFLFPSVFFRINSSSDHLRKPVEAIRMMMANPLGLGLGTAGPASNRFSDTCVQLPKNSDWSWAKERQDLCVFVDGTQMQPASRTCSCPLLTENWYLQIGVELGVIGFVLYLILIVFLLKRMAEFSIFNFQFSIFLIFLGLSLSALFLHAFEDSAVAYTVWVLLAVAFATLIPCQRKSRRSQGQS